MRFHLSPAPVQRDSCPRDFWPFVGALMTLLLLFCAPVSAALPAALDGKRLPSLAPMLERVTPAVVNIATRGMEVERVNPLTSDPFFKRFFNLPERRREKPTESLGSGVIVDARRGYILTNHHVIDKAREITVTLRDGRSLKARVVGTDPDTDVAVIQVKARRLKALKMADSERLRVGDFVVAIGNPFGLGQTVTSGIVSALGRTGLGIEGYEDFIQTDASINVGNSGGALVNLRGELVGINTAILAPGGGSVGVGFAIPSNMAGDIMDQLVRHGKVRRGVLGLVAQDVTAELAEAFALPRGAGAIVVRVLPGSAAEKAGVREGDVLVRVNGKPVRNAGSVRTIVGLSRVGDEIAMEVLRDARSLKLNARIPEPDESSVDGLDVHPRLSGALFANIAPQHPLFGRVEGAMIAKMRRGSPAYSIGLRPGDIVTQANGYNLRSLEDLQRATEHGRDRLLIVVQRGNSTRQFLLR